MGGRSHWVWIALVVLIGSVGVEAQSRRPRTPEAREQEAAARAELERLVLEAGEGRVAEAARGLSELSMRTLDASPEVFVEVDRARRWTELAVEGRASERVIDFFTQNAGAAAAFTRVIAPEDDAGAALRALDELLATFGDAKVAEFGDLAAALCVVHERPYRRRVNENSPSSPARGEIFLYYADGATNLQLNPKQLPASLLVHVVNTTESLDEMSWAWRSYSRDWNHGARYAEIEYDYDHARLGKPKGVTASGNFCLTGIKQHGGVCADQAYFAEHVAKANGVPAVYMRGRSGDVGHAWLGFLRVQGSRAWWDFSVGRYADYQDVRGVVEDPQTGRLVTDAELTMIAEAAKTPVDRQDLAIGLVDAVGAIGQDAATLERRLDLLEQAATASPNEPRVWRAFAKVAASGQMSEAQLDKWLAGFSRTHGRSSPDVMAEILDLVTEGIEDAQTRIDVWEWAVPRFGRRGDLQALARTRQAEAFEQMGDYDNAWRGYEDIAVRFTNDGPFAADAVFSQASLLERRNEGEGVADLFGRAFERTEQPSSFAIEFVRASNWFRLGTAYAKALTKEGRRAEAAAVLAKMGVRPR